MGGDSPLDRLAEVLPQVPGVGHLHRLWGAGAGALRVGSGPVAADALHLGVSQEPGGQRPRVASRQDVDGTAALQVDQDGGVRVTFPQGEIVDAEHPDVSDGLLREGSEQA